VSAAAAADSIAQPNASAVAHWKATIPFAVMCVGMFAALLDIQIVA
jgi:hypothetical protein